MTDPYNEAGELLCVACHAEVALPGAFCCRACCPEPEPEPEPDVWQPTLGLEAVPA